MTEYIPGFGIVPLHAQIDIDASQAFGDRPFEQWNDVLSRNPDQQIERTFLFVCLDLQNRRVPVNQQFEIFLFRHD